MNFKQEIERIRIAVVILLVLIGLAFVAWTLATAAGPSGKSYPGPYPGPYPAPYPAYLPFQAGESYP